MPIFKIGDFVVARNRGRIDYGMVVDIDTGGESMEIAMNDGDRKIVRKSTCSIDPFPDERENN